jgi:hypothetical protein
MAPLCLTILTVSLILADSSLIRFAMFLIASAVCSGVISLMFVVVVVEVVVVEAVVLL